MIAGSIVEALVDGQFKEHCRELVLEGRLDWDGLDVGTLDFDAAIQPVAQPGGPITGPRRARRPWGLGRWRDGSGVRP